MAYRIILFLLLNFAALAIGGISTSKGVVSEWYAGLNKAPWTPPGWVFGFAWTSIMICFSIYLAMLWPNVENKNVFIALYVLQWCLNVAWNPVFFNLQFLKVALLLIVSLTCLIAYYQFSFWSVLKIKSIFIAPYFIWLLIATSLNTYIVLKN